ncbi:DUF4388 domain-containing protein, partial [Acidobacteriota bacterium]
GAGTQFDPEIVEIFLSLVRRRGLEAHESEAPPKIVLLAGLSVHAEALLACRFDSAGQLVIDASNKEDMKDKLNSARPDFVICDIDGLGVSGSTAAELRAELGVGTIPCLWLTLPDLPIAKELSAEKTDRDHVIVRPAHLQDIVAEANTAMLRSDFLQASKGREAPKDVCGIQGNLIELGIIEIVQMLHQGQKTAVVTLWTVQDRGRLYFVSGHVKHAQYAEAAGEEAFMELMKLTEGEFLIEHTRTPPTITIDKRTDFLLLETMRLIDEAENRGQSEDIPEEQPLTMQ